jgi:general secretion pathway protein D
MNHVPNLARTLALLAFVLASALLSGCTSVPQQAQHMAQAGNHAQGIALLTQAVQRNPDDTELRSALDRQRSQAINLWTSRAEQSLAAGRIAESMGWYEQTQALDATHPRVKSLKAQYLRLDAQDKLLAQANVALEGGQYPQSQSLVNQVLAQAPDNAAARALKRKLREVNSAVAPLALGSAYQRPVNLEFRDAPLRSIMDALARTTGVNFVFDPDVKDDTKITIQLKDSTVDDALKIILAMKQLERKVLSENSLLIYPATPEKQKQYQEFISKSFYLMNANVTQTQTLIRTIAKTKDLFVDERLNLIVVRDTPEVLRLVERLVESIDIAEPEVMLEVEVMEVASNRLDSLGLQWPTSISYGLDPSVAQIVDGQTGLAARIANPSLVAALKETVTNSDTLANPRLRVRNREKAKIMIGDKLPVFSSTSTANVGISSSVSYLDVGLKVEVEPSVLLDNDVVLRINLEMSSVTATVSNSQGTTGYQIGSRQASSSIRLHDGETQVFAGLIRDEDTKSISGLPGLARLPILGRLFGVQGDGKNKSELVLFITPRVIRNLALPDSSASNGPAGIESSPGAIPMQMSPKSTIQVPLGSDNASRAPNSRSVSQASPFTRATSSRPSAEFPPISQTPSVGQGGYFSGSQEPATDTKPSFPAPAQ